MFPMFTSGIQNSQIRIGDFNETTKGRIEGAEQKVGQREQENKQAKKTKEN